MNPALQIGSLVQVKSILDYFNGEYKIIKLARSGDGLGGDWQSRGLRQISENGKRESRPQKKQAEMTTLLGKLSHFKA